MHARACGVISRRKDSLVRLARSRLHSSIATFDSSGPLTIMGSNGETWRPIAAAKQAQRQSLIPKTWLIPPSLLPPPTQLNVHSIPITSGLLTRREILLTSATATEIVKRIASQEWTALEVTTAVCHRAAIAQQLVNCLTEINFTAALARARELDAYQRANGGKTIGPLHGLPMSLKDQFKVAGLDATVGYAAWANNPVQEGDESVLVDVLRKAGAVIIAKTNVPVTLMMGESVNNLFGRTVHPRNRELTSGGSSGGESALVSMGGSPMGVGTDIGGSIRHPCSFTGLWGLRPSHGRVPYFNCANTMQGQEGVKSTAGPMCRSPEDIGLFMSAVVGGRSWESDPGVIPLPWRGELEKLPQKLCFGFSMGDGHVQPSPPMVRAMKLVRERLEAAGHKVIDFLATENKQAHEIVMKMWTVDGGEEVRREADKTGEPLPPTVDGWLGRAAAARGILKPASVLDTWDNQHARMELAGRWLKRWKATATETGTGRPIDALIMPSTPFPAIRHGGNYSWQYGELPPLLDLSTGIFPVTRVDLAQDVVPEGWKPLSDRDKQLMKFYGSPKNHENAPVGLALIAGRLEDEKVVGLLKLIKEIGVMDYDPEDESGIPLSPKLA